MYYLPQYAPIIAGLQQEGVEVTLAVYFSENSAGAQRAVIDSVCPAVLIEWVKGEEHACDLYLKMKPDWLVIGNKLECLEGIHKSTKTALVGHSKGQRVVLSNVGVGYNCSLYRRILSN